MSSHLQSGSRPAAIQRPAQTQTSSQQAEDLDPRGSSQPQIRAEQTQASQSFPQQPFNPHFYGPPPPGRGYPPYGYPPPGQGFPNMLYGAPPPPGWYPTPVQGFLGGPPGPFPPGPMGFGAPPGHPLHQQGPLGAKSTGPGSIGVSAGPSAVEKDRIEVSAATSQLPLSSATPAPRPDQTANRLAAPFKSKPDTNSAAIPDKAATKAQAVTKPPTGAQSGRIFPAIPFQAPGQPRSSLPTNGQAKAKPQPNAAAANAAIQNATQMATAAVAAAMAKLPPAPDQQSSNQINKQGPSDGMDHPTKRVNEMRSNDQTHLNSNVRTSRQPSQPGSTGASGHRGGRGGGRGGGPHHNQSHPQQGRKVEVPKTDYDFASANAKFNKQDLVKEVIATGSPTGEKNPSPATAIHGAGIDGLPTGNGTSDKKEGAAKVTPTYNKASSFFDNISSETKDRSDNQGNRPGGREWRGEEVKRNLETFGQGSVDNGGYRGGYRGRGAGRGRGQRGRGRAGSGQRGAMASAGRDAPITASQ